MGLKNAGFRVIAAVEIDRLSVETYKANHREVAVWQSDIRDLSPLDLSASLGLGRGDLELLAGCPPCQGFSTMRTLNGALTVEDPRNDLLLEFQRFVEALLPRAVMLENVPGLAEDQRFAELRRQMEQLGYQGGHRILNAADYGVPQRRRRLIYMAGLGFQIPFANPISPRTTVRDAISRLPKAGESNDPVHDMPEHRSQRIIDLIKRIPKNGGSRGDLPAEEQLNCHKRCNGFTDVYGRMTWDDVAPTITSGCFNPSKGRFLHPDQDRAITMREAALLQSFPHKYRFPSFKNKTATALMIGNALPPELIRRHAVIIRTFLDNIFLKSYTEKKGRTRNGKQHS